MNYKELVEARKVYESQKEEREYKKVLDYVNKCFDKYVKGGNVFELEVDEDELREILDEKQVDYVIEHNPSPFGSSEIYLIIK